MKTLLVWLAQSVVALLQSLPLGVVARLGRAGGALVYWLDGRHRRVARRNLAMCFPEKSPAEITKLARENFRRIGENFACAVKTAVMTDAEIAPHLEFIHEERLQALDLHGQRPRNLVVAIGHFGNFEVFARAARRFVGYQGATTYRALPHPALNAVLMGVRKHSQCRFFERRTDAAALKESMNRGGVILGLLADQNAGRRGVRIPFLGHDCYTSIAPAVLALRYEAQFFTAICHRVAPGRWAIEWGEAILLHESGHARPPGEVMRDVNQAFEVAIRRDPANWFWVHNRWRAEKAGKMRKTLRNETEAGEDAAD